MARKKRGHGGHHGGAWKVAYADFVTAMMALFLVLWLINMIPTEKKSGIADYFKDPLAFKNRSGIHKGTEYPLQQPIVAPPPVPSQNNAAVLRQQQEIFVQVQELVAQGKLAKLEEHLIIRKTDQGVEISLFDKANKPLFAIGSANPMPTMNGFLKELGVQLAKLQVRMAIRGHTDARPLQRAGYTNWELSADRANRVRAIMTGNGLPNSRLQSVQGLADTEPLNVGNPNANENRRISVLLVGYIDGAGTGAGAASSAATPSIPEIVPIVTEPKAPAHDPDTHSPVSEPEHGIAHHSTDTHHDKPEHHETGHDTHDVHESPEKKAPAPSKEEPSAWHRRF